MASAKILCKFSKFFYVFLLSIAAHDLGAAERFAMDVVKAEPL